MAATESPDGGLRRLDLLSTLAPVTRTHSLAVPDSDTFAVTEIDLMSSQAGAAISVQTGRAKTNNGALLSVLAAASMVEVRWLIIVVPERYKGSTTAGPIRKDLLRLARSKGVSLSVDGVQLMSF